MQMAKERSGFTIRPEANENIGLKDRCGVYPFNALTFFFVPFSLDQSKLGDNMNTTEHILKLCVRNDP